MGRVIVSGGCEMSVPVGDILAQDLAVGAVVKLMESDVATEFVVVNQGIPSGSSMYDESCNGTWLLRKDVNLRDSVQPRTANYQYSQINTYLDNIYFNLLGTLEQSLVKEIKIPYGVPNSTTVYTGSNGLSTKIFALGAYELGFTTTQEQNLLQDGVKLDYFLQGTDVEASNRRKFYYDDHSITSGMHCWGRSVASSSTVVIWYNAGDTGGYSWRANDETGPLRPCLILPFTSRFDPTTLLLKG